MFKKWGFDSKFSISSYFLEYLYNSAWIIRHSSPIYARDLRYGCIMQIRFNRADGYEKFDGRWKGRRLFLRA